MTRDDLYNGNTASIVRESYKLVDAMDKVDPPTPARKLQALAFLSAMVADLLDYNPRALMELGEGIRREMTKIEPKQVAAMKSYIREELLK